MYKGNVKQQLKWVNKKINKQNRRLVQSKNKGYEQTENRGASKDGNEAKGSSQCYGKGHLVGSDTLSCHFTQWMK